MIHLIIENECRDGMDFSKKYLGYPGQSIARPFEQRSAVVLDLLRFDVLHLHDRQPSVHFSPVVSTKRLRCLLNARWDLLPQADELSTHGRISERFDNCGIEAIDYRPRCAVSNP